eukprot:Rhum_TRINITY_DN2024_c0_g2::Rhum_TRINITY_DN2024_c0_g2_i1::g.5478::m.5478
MSFGAFGGGSFSGGFGGGDGFNPRQHTDNALTNISYLQTDVSYALGTIKTLDNTAEQVCASYGAMAATNKTRTEDFISSIEKKHFDLVDEALKKQNKVRVTNAEANALYEGPRLRAAETAAKRRRFDAALAADLEVAKQEKEARQVAELTAATEANNAWVEGKKALQKQIAVLREDIQKQKDLGASIRKICSVPIVQTVRTTPDF